MTLDPSLLEALKVLDSLPLDARQIALTRIFPWFIDKTIAEQERKNVPSFRDWLIDWLVLV